MVQPCNILPSPCVTNFRLQTSSTSSTRPSFAPSTQSSPSLLTHLSPARLNLTSSISSTQSFPSSPNSLSSVPFSSTISYFKPVFPNQSSILHPNVSGLFNLIVFSFFYPIISRFINHVVSFFFNLAITYSINPLISASIDLLLL